LQGIHVPLPNSAIVGFPFERACGRGIDVRPDSAAGSD